MTTSNDDNKVNETVLMKRAAALAITGANLNQMTKKLGISRYLVEKLCAKEEFKQLVNELSDSEIVPIITKARKELSKLVFEAIRVLKHQLSENSLEAAKIVFKSIGLEDQEMEKRDSEINIFLPGNEAPTKVVEQIVPEYTVQIPGNEDAKID